MLSKPPPETVGVFDMQNTVCGAHCRKGCCDLKIQRFRAAIFLETLDGRCYEFSCRGDVWYYVSVDRGIPCPLTTDQRSHMNVRLRVQNMIFRRY